MNRADRYVLTCLRYCVDSKVRAGRDRAAALRPGAQVAVVHQPGRRVRAHGEADVRDEGANNGPDRNGTERNGMERNGTEWDGMERTQMIPFEMKRKALACASTSTVVYVCMHAVRRLLARALRGRLLTDGTQRVSSALRHSGPLASAALRSVSERRSRDEGTATNGPSHLDAHTRCAATRAARTHTSRRVATRTPAAMTTTRPSARCHHTSSPPPSPLMVNGRTSSSHTTHTSRDDGRCASSTAASHSGTRARRPSSTPTRSAPGAIWRSPR